MVDVPYPYAMNIKLQSVSMKPPMKFVNLDYNQNNNKLEILFKKSGNYDAYMIFTPYQGEE